VRRRKAFIRNGDSEYAGIDLLSGLDYRQDWHNRNEHARPTITFGHLSLTGKVCRVFRRFADFPFIPSLPTNPDGAYSICMSYVGVGVPR
jgi:hypothetical protein